MNDDVAVALAKREVIRIMEGMNLRSRCSLEGGAGSEVVMDRKGVLEQLALAQRSNHVVT